MACGATLKRSMQFDTGPHLMSPSASKRRRCGPVSASSSPSSSSSSSSSVRRSLRCGASPFEDVTARITTEQILHNIKQEYKRMQKRRNLEGGFYQNEACSSLESHPHPSILTGASFQETSPGAISPTRREQPLFTLRQVGMICERLLKEREDKVREEYEEIMTTKLAEQYDTFVKFTHDQLMRRFEEQPASYVS